MIRIAIRFVPKSLKDILGIALPQIVYVPDHFSLKDLFKKLDKLSGSKLLPRILREGVIILLNGKTIHKGDLEERRPIRDFIRGDPRRIELVILPIVGGG